MGGLTTEISPALMPTLLARAAGAKASVRLFAAPAAAAEDADPDETTVTSASTLVRVDVTFVSVSELTFSWLARSLELTVGAARLELLMGGMIVTSKRTATSARPRRDDGAAPTSQVSVVYPLHNVSCRASRICDELTPGGSSVSMAHFCLITTRTSAVPPELAAAADES